MIRLKVFLTYIFLSNYTMKTVKIRLFNNCDEASKPKYAQKGVRHSRKHIGEMCVNKYPYKRISRLYKL